MAESIRGSHLPNTDSIQELARYWDTHDLTDFEGDLEQVTEPVFVRARDTSLTVNLKPAEVEHLKKVARSKGLTETAVVRQWILERLHGVRKAPDEVLQRTAQKRRRR